MLEAALPHASVASTGTSKGASVEEGSAQLSVGLRPADYVTIVLYFLLTFGISIWFGRKQKNVDDYFVGGRRMPWFAVGLSILATLFSTLSYLAVPGEMINKGIGYFMGYLAEPFTAFVVLGLWIPFFMRLRLTSAYEYLELRFGRIARTLGASLFIALRLGWMSMVTFAASKALTDMVGTDSPRLPGDDIYWTVGAIGVISAVYTALGGIQAMIWVDVIQCMLLLSGVLLAIGGVAWMDGTGPVDWWHTASQYGPTHSSVEFFSFDVTTRTTVVFVMLGNFFWTISTHGSDQVVLQRYFSTSSLRSARRSYLINLCVNFSMSVLLGMAGLALLAFYLKHPGALPEGITTPTARPDRLFPHFLGSQLPAGCVGLIISAFLCDAIQTLESGINAISAVVTNDFFNPSKAHASDDVGPVSELSESSKLKIARGVAIVVGAIVLSTALAVAYWTKSRPDLTLLDMMPKFFNLFVGPLAALFVVGMFIPRARTRTAIPAALLGLTLSILWSWWREITGAEKAPSPFLAIFVPWTTTVASAWLLSLFFGSDEDDPKRNYTWRSVMKRIPHPTGEE